MQGRTGPSGSDANCFGNNLPDTAMALIPMDAGYHPHFVVNQVATKVTVIPNATADRTTRTIVQRVLWRSRLCHRYRTNKELCIKESVGRAYELNGGCYREPPAWISPPQWDLSDAATPQQISASGHISGKSLARTK